VIVVFNFGASAIAAVPPQPMPPLERKLSGHERPTVTLVIVVFNFSASEIDAAPSGPILLAVTPPPPRASRRAHEPHAYTCNAYGTLTPQVHARDRHVQLQRSGETDKARGIEPVASTESEDVNARRHFSNRLIRP
jgi:hypothetical protein